MRSSRSGYFKRAFAIAAATLLVGVLAGSATRHVLASPSGGGSGYGGGVSIGINIGNVLDAINKANQQPKEQSKPKQKSTPAKVSCGANQVSSKGKCVCKKGYAWDGNSCEVPHQEAKPKAKPKHDEPEVDIAVVQGCLTKVGYDAGDPDGKAGRQTMDAWYDFQKAHSLKKTGNFDDKPTLTVLFGLCEDKPQPPTIIQASADPAAPLGPTRALTPIAPAQAPQRCLPRDLHDMLARAYGRQPALAPCPPGGGACLPKPASYTQAKLNEATRSLGINWCETCVQLGTWLPLTAVLAIEAAANVTLCASPPACLMPVQPVSATRTEVRTIFRTLPRSVGNDGDIAVIVGNEKYSAPDVPANANAHSDATAVRTLLLEQLGFRDDHIIDLRDAKLADLERVFGTREGGESELGTRLAQNNQADVFVYVSSFGMVDEASKQAYLLPVDAGVDRLDASAYPLQRLYDNLGKIGARSIMLMLEADFARNVGELIDPPNLPELDVAAMPETPIPGLAVFKASDRDQRTLEDPEYGIGLFTRYMIEGMAGKADEGPIGNTDSRIDAVELFVYTSDLVRTAARKSFGVEQKPLLSEIGNLVVGQLAN